MRRASRRAHRHRPEPAGASAYDEGVSGSESDLDDIISWLGSTFFSRLSGGVGAAHHAIVRRAVDWVQPRVVNQLGTAYVRLSDY